jgi:prepilin-type N-terminal cleavage/methylation domain-containing protein
MKRAGFTMIELIFVIVILGILSAVALPKFIGVSDQAKAGKCKAFIGTLNRTTLPAIWSATVLDDGVVAAADFNSSELETNIDFPTDCNMTSAQVASAIGGTSFTVTYGGSTYTIDQNVSPSVNESPILSFVKN